MPTYEATFEIESKIDAHTVRLLVERMYDAFREELGETGGVDSPSSETLDDLKAIREAAKHRSSGKLTIIYEQSEETFDD